ncbi:hypothetical protein BHU72_12340 [Desulfuribacillus stibiiarsenatis]|uniref:Murein hydrolase transporter LrgA n=1 Tax=Desulfuribacillus stibiiarsenatis TaxID=1390249 RepID=A0A1E5L252_9FIRM|nr:CidA/LrgA family protein [Desulfuribacillus stibiiarsenatis]OEH84186.1 hypothetical protein BHU72_12340 [Desulfuribacillus stibiiarsenatis]
MNQLPLLKKSVVTAIQITFLYTIYFLCGKIIDFLHWPLPAGVIGMIVLFGLLLSGIVPMKWVESGGNLLLNNLPFMFIAVAVGLMPFGQLFLTHWFSMLVTVLISTAVGIYVTGAVTQFLKQYFKDKKRKDMVNDDQHTHSL